MHHVSKFARIAILPALAALLLAGGCGDGSVPLDPEGGEKLRQARINAYGKSGYTAQKGAGAVASGGSQGRARAQQGGR